MTFHIHSGMMLQEAIDRLEGQAGSACSHRVFEAFPESRVCLCWPAQWRRRAPFTVHEMPHVVWRRTHSHDESEAGQGSRSDLADAAFTLLTDTTLAEAVHPPQQQQRHAGRHPKVPFKQQPKPSASSAWNWEMFAQECLAPHVRVAAAAQLVGEQGATASLPATCSARMQVRLTLACGVTP